MNIPDANFKAAINGYLGQPVDYNPTVADLNGISVNFDATNSNISSIEGVQYLVNTPALMLATNQISDISGISNLTNLVYIHLSVNQISDISAVSALTNLNTLLIENNQIVDISAVSALTGLMYFYAGGNQISDISAVSNLTNLSQLAFNVNQITDISPVSGLTSISYLCLSDNQISNISVISSLTNLTDLFLNSNQISDISAISGLLFLDRLSLYSNQISDIFALIENTGLGYGNDLYLAYSGGTNPLSQEALNVHIPILEDRGLSNFEYPFTPNNEAACYPNPIRNEIEVLLNSDLEWQGNFSRNANYDVWLGETTDYLINVGNGTSISDTLYSFTPTLNPNTDYWWKVRAVTATDTIWSGLWHFTTGEIFALTADFTVSDTLTVAGTEIQFTDLTTGTPISWQWDFDNDGAIDSEQQNPVWTYDDPEIYTVSLTVSDGTRISETETKIDYIDVRVNIPDANFKVAINNKLGQPTDYNPTIADLNGITGSLYADNANIFTIEGSQYLTNLTGLYLFENQINDISKVSGLTNLTSLYLSHNQISDISSISGLTNLIWLGLDYNQISDISPVSGLTNLSKLNLNKNEISDISALVENTGLGSGDDLYLERYGLGNPLSQEALNVHIPILESRGFDTLQYPSDPNNYAACYPNPVRNEIEVFLNSDLEWQGNFIRNANYDVWLGETAENLVNVGNATIVSDTLYSFTPTLNASTDYWWKVRAVTATDTIWSGLWHFTTGDAVALTADFTVSDTLTIAGTEIQFTDLSAGIPTSWQWDFDNDGAIDSELQNPTWIYGEPGIYTVSLTISDTTLRMSEGLRNGDRNRATSTETKIDYIDVRVNIPDANFKVAINNKLGQPTDYNPTIADLNGITGTFDAHNSNISSIEGAQYLTNLTNLQLSENQISDIFAVSSLSNLTSLGLNLNQISEISAVSGLTNLTNLNFSHNPISEISAVSGLTNLTSLYLYDIQISDISAISGLTSLSELSLGDNQISDISTVSGLTNLSTLYLNKNQISDILAISGLANLHTLYLYDNQISDIYPLVENIEFGSGDLLRLEYEGTTNPLSQEALNIHIPILESRGFATLDYSSTPNNYAACYPNPARNETEVFINNSLEWQGNFTRNANYDIWLGESADNLINVGNGTIVSNTLYSFTPTLNANTDYWWKVRAITATDTIWSGLWHFTTGDEVVLTADFTVSDTLIISDTEIQFTDLSAGIPTSWQWDFDNDSTIDSELQNPNWIYDEPGIYTVSLTVSDDVLIRKISRTSRTTETETKTDYIDVRVNIPDANFKAAINSKLGQPADYNPTEADLNGMTGTFNAENSTISSIEGAQYLTNLTSLYLGNNQISDISAVSDLTNLTYLILNNNQISDISTISDLTNLTYLNLGSNQISNISAISGLTNLTQLWLFDNQISDISAVSGLTNLISLSLWRNQISDISQVSGLTNLTALYLYSNQISDIYPLVENTGLGSGDHLYLKSEDQTNPLSQEALNIHIPILESRGFDSLLYPSEPNNEAACYPNPFRNETGVFPSANLEWRGNFIRNADYDVWLGESADDLINVGNGTMVSDTLYSFTPTLAPNTDYWWKVKAVTWSSTIWSGLWHFTTGDAAALSADFSADQTAVVAGTEIQFTDLSLGIPTSWQWDFDNDGTIDSNEQNPTWTYDESGIYTISLTVNDGTRTTDTETKTDYITVTNDFPFAAVANSSGSISVINLINNFVYGPFLESELDASGLLEIVMIPNTNTAIVTCFDQDVIKFIDFSNPLNPVVEETHDIGFAPEDIEVTENGKYAVITDGGSSTYIAIVDIYARATVETINLTPRQLQAVDISSTGLILGADYNNNLVHVFIIDINNGNFTDLNTSVAVGAGPINISISPDGSLALVANNGSNELSVLSIDEYNNVIVSDTVAGGAQSVIFSSDMSKAYAVSINSAPDQLAIYNVSNGAVVDSGTRINLVSDVEGAYYGVDVISISLDGNRAFVGNPSSSGTLTNMLSIVNLNDEILENTIEIGNYPITTAFGNFGLYANFVADNTKIYTGSSVQFTDLSIGNPISWEWDFDNDGTIDSELQNPIWIYDEPGIYTVSLTVSDGTRTTETKIKTDYITVTNDFPFAAVTNSSGSISVINLINDFVYGPFLENEFNDNDYGLLEIVMIPNTNMAIVTCFDQNMIKFIDFSNPLNPVVEETYDIGFAPEDIEVTTNGKYAVITDGGNSTYIAIVDIYARATVETINLAPRELQAVAISPTGLILGADYNNNLVHVFTIDINNGNFTDLNTSVAVGMSPINITISPDGSLALVANIASDDLSVLSIDQDNNVIVSDTVAGDAQSVIFASDMSKAYAVLIDPAPDQFAIYNVLNGTVVDSGNRIDLISDSEGYFYGVDVISVSPDGEKAFVGNPNDNYGTPTNMLAIVNLNDEILENTIETANYPIATAFGNFGLNANFVADCTEIYTGSSVQFTDLSIGKPVYWEWDFDNNGAIDSYEPNPTCIYEVPGIYSVSLTVNDGTRATDTETKIDYIIITDEIQLPPIVENPLGSIEMTINTPDSSSVNLNNVFSDPNDDQLYFSYGGNEHIDVEILANGNVLITPHHNWLGSEEIIFYADDEDIIRKSARGNRTQVADILIVNVNPEEGPFVGEGAVSGIWDNISAPYNVSGDIYVPYGQELTIIGTPDSMVTVIFYGDYTFTIDGVLNAENVEFLDYDNNIWGGIIINDETNTTELTNCVIQNAQNGIIINNSSPTLTSILINNTIVTRNISGKGMIINDVSSPVINNLVIKEYSGIGIEILNTTESLNIPTLTNIRVQNSSNSTRDTLNVGMNISGKVAVVMNDVELNDFSTGLNYSSDGSDLLGIPTLTNIRVQNSSNSTRSGLIGLKFENVNNFAGNDIQISAEELSSLETGIEIITTGDNASIPTLTNIRVQNSSNSTRDTLNVGIKISGKVAANMDDIELKDFNTGLNYSSDGSDLLEIPTLTNIRVQNSSNSTRINNRGMVFENVPEFIAVADTVQNYNVGIEIITTGENTSIPTLTNIRVQNSSNSTRDSLNVGINISGKVAANMEDIEINDFNTGLNYSSDGSDLLGIPTLTNIRVQNSSNSTRSGLIGLKFENVNNFDGNDIQISAEEMSSLETGIEIITTGENTSIPTLTNIRVQNSSNSTRDTLNVGIKISGKVAANMDDIELKDFNTGLNYSSDGSDLLEIPTLTNIRVQNSSNSTRINNRGMVFENVPEFIAVADTVQNYNVGIEIITTGENTSIPTLTNIRVQNSSNSTRDSLNVGINISGKVVANMEDIELNDFNTGLNYSSDGSDLLGIPTLTNIRVQNSSNSTRSGLIGLKFENVNNFAGNDIQISAEEMSSLETGIEIITTGDNASIPTLTNIRVQNSSNSTRDTLNVGIKISGKVAANMDDIELNDFNTGLNYSSDGSELLEIPTLTNIRVQNSSNSTRINTNGMVFEDVWKFYAIGDTIYNCNSGIKIRTSNRNSSIPTLTNIRVQNSSNSTRNGDMVGIKLIGNIENGNICNNTIANCDSALVFTGNVSSLVDSNTVYYLVETTTRINPIGLYAENSDLILGNNTFHNFHNALNLNQTNVELHHNIIWDDEANLDIIVTDGNSTLTAISNTVYLPNEEVLDGVGNINNDPRFLHAEPDAVDFHLKNGVVLMSSIGSMGFPDYEYNTELESNWNLVGIPVTLEWGHNHPVEVLADDIDPFSVYPYSSSILTFESSINNFVVPDSIITGEGYWLLANEGGPVDAIGYIEYDSLTVQIPGENNPNNGWHLVANPYDEPILFSNITLNGDVEQAGWIYNAQSNSYEVIMGNDTLPKWSGMFIKGHSADAEIIFNYQQAATRKNREDVDSSQWFVRLSATNETSQSMMIAGASEGASDGYDTNDILTLPNLPFIPEMGRIKLYSAHNNWENHSGNYTRDMMNTENEEWLYPLQLSARSSVTISAADLGNIPDEYDIIIRNLLTNETVDLRNGDLYISIEGIASETVRSERENIELELRIGENLTENTGEIVPVYVLDLYQNYPNPFNPTTAIKFSLPEEALVNLSVYNIKGQKVTELVNEKMKKGYNIVEWNGKDSSNKISASGVYFYKLIYQDKELVRKMLMLK